MKKRYTGAIIGQGKRFKALQRAWATRFSQIDVSILIPLKNEKIRFKINFDAGKGKDLVTLTRKNYQTGETETLYKGYID